MGTRPGASMFVPSLGYQHEAAILTLALFGKRHEAVRRYALGVALGFVGLGVEQGCIP